MLPTLLSLCQMAALVPLLHTILLTYQLPSHVEERYDIYQDVGGAPARMLLPFKAESFPSLATDAELPSETEDDVQDQIPYCGGSGEAGDGSQRLTQLPEWILPTDESGMLAFSATLVCLSAHMLPPCM